MADGNVELLGRALNLTPRRIQQLVKEGMPKAQRGVYEISACMMWYIKYLQKALDSRQDTEVRDETVKWTKERTRLAKEQADSSQLKNSELRGELVRVFVVERLVGKAMTIFRANTLAIPVKLATELEGCKAAEIKAILERETRQLLAEISDFNFRGAPSHTGDLAGARARETTEADDGEPVGGRAPTPKHKGKRRARPVANSKS